MSKQNLFGFRWREVLKSGLQDSPIDVIHKLDPWHLKHNLRYYLPKKLREEINFLIFKKHDAKKALDIVKGYSMQNPKHKGAKFLKSYLSKNLDSIDTTSPTLGTIEATNSHLVAERCKHYGGGWSEQGARNILTCRNYILSNLRKVA
jgi:hypothetical protein